jgi:BirA family transcriptional regulator, biotin operon repressor / biotin---[acetyl-CoA-carboxylase] ligase
LKFQKNDLFSGNKSTTSLASAVMPPDGLFNILARVDSTNNYAMAMAHAGMAEHGMAWFAHEQTAGRGRRGRDWLGQAGQNITLSVVLRPPGPFWANPFSLSMAASLACFRFFEALAGDPTRIKWPNDLYWGDRKAGGLLIENSYQGTNWQWAVVGMGININQTVFGEGAKNPVSLRQITGKSFDVEALARQLHGGLLQTVEELAALPLAERCDAYNRHLYRRGQAVRLKKGSQVFATTLTGVSPQGLLLTADTMERAFGFDEVEFVHEGP